MKTEPPDFVFKSTFDDESDSDDSEIEVIPYVKPPPVVIDIVESEEEEDESNKKRKKKKKKSKKSRERECGEEETSASCSTSYSTSEATISLENGIVPCEDERSELISPVVEPAPVTGKELGAKGSKDGTEIESSSSKQSSSSAAASVAKGTNSERGSQRKEVNNSDVSLASGAGLAGSTTPQNARSAVPRTPGSDDGGKQKQTRRRRGEVDATQKRKRTPSATATQRTNEEIINFLTTMGIEVGSNAFDSPAKRGRPKKKKANEENPIAVAEADSTTGGDKNQSTSSGFVSVTEEATPASKKRKAAASPTKRKKSRQSFDGDLSDYQISFSEQGQDSLPTNIQSNFQVGSGEFLGYAASDTVDQAIDAVIARGIDNPRRDIPAAEGKAPEYQQDMDIESTPAAADKEDAETVNEAPEPVIPRDPPIVEPNGASELPAMKQIEQTSEAVSEISPKKRKASAATTKPDEANTPVVLDITIPDDKENRPGTSKDDGQQATTSKAGPSSLEATNINPKVTFLPVFPPQQSIPVPPPASNAPSTWTPNMIDFYDTIRNEDFRLRQAYRGMSDLPHMWIAPEDMMAPPRSKTRSMRCHRCQQFGHLVNQCKEKWKPPTCHMCGVIGHTSDPKSRYGHKCRQTKCLNCGNYLPHYASKCVNCVLRRNPSRCPICNVIGHTEAICPDNWRRYHSITTLDEFDKANEKFSKASGAKEDKELYKRSSAMFCANCGQRGHSYYDCGESRPSPYHRHKPFVRYPLSKLEPDLPREPAPVAEVYDKNTGRTLVVMDDSDRPEIAVETIQVQIQNELAVIEKCEQPTCTNKLPRNERCYSIVVQPRAHNKLTKAVDEIKEIQEKYGVQLCVVPGTSLIHVYGAKQQEAETDLYRYLWSKPKKIKENDQEIFSVKPEKKSQGKSAGSDPNPPCITIEDDDDLQVIDELPPKPVTMTKKEKSKEKQKDRELNKDKSPTKKGDQSEKPDKDKGNGKSQRKSSDSSSSKNRNSTGSALSLDYESPLLGLPSMGGPSLPEQQNQLESNVQKVCPNPNLDFTEDVDPFDSKDMWPNPNFIPAHLQLPPTGIGAFTEPQPPPEPRVQMQHFEDDFILEGAEVIDHAKLQEPQPGPSKFSVPAFPSNDNDVKPPKQVSPDKEKADDDIEIVTIDDDASTTEDESQQNPTSKDEKVTILQSEWALVTSILLQKDNPINSIASRFKVGIEAFKEGSGQFVRIFNGTEMNRRIAKDNVIHWLGCQPANTPFKILPRGNMDILTLNKEREASLGFNKKRKKNKNLPPPVISPLTLNDVLVASSIIKGKTKSYTAGKKYNKFRKQLYFEKKATATRKPRPNKNPPAPAPAVIRKQKPASSAAGSEAQSNKGGQPTNKQRYFHNGLKD